MNPAIITIDKNGIVQNIDKNCTSLFGYEPEEFVGKPVKMIIPSPYNEQHDDYIANYLKTGRERMIGKTREVEGLHKDGSIIPIKLSVMKVGDGDGVTFVGILHKVEEDVVVITCTDEGTILQSTNTTRRFLGYTSEELVGSDISNLIPLSDQEDHHRYLRNYLNGKQNEFVGCPRNLTAESKSGDKIPICLSLENVGIGPNTEQFFKATIHKVDTVTVFTVSGTDGKIKSCSPCVRNLLGYSQVELVGSSITSIAPVFYDDSSCRRNSCEEPNRKRQKIFISGSVCLDNVPIKWLTGSFNNTILHKDGSCISAIIRVFPFEHNSETLYSVQIKRSEDPGFNSSQELKCIGDYVLGKTIGRGSFGKVKLGTHKSSGLKVAIKILQKAFISAERVSRTRMEIEMLRNLQHPNITKLYQVIETDESLNLILELAGGTLQAAIPPNGFSEPEATEIFVQIVSAVKYCHDNRIIHRDLKGDNILISNGICKIIDFGLGNFVKDGELRTTFCGTPAFAAPEMILGKKYDGPEVDIWSLGVILFCLVTGNYPFEKIEDVLNCKYVIPDKISDNCRDLIRRILESEIPSRITLPGMCSHPWLKARFDSYESRISTSPIFRSSSSSICSISRSSSSLKLEEGENSY